MAFTVLCVGMTALLGVVEPLLLALAVGAIATFAFNTADSQYHPLLAVVAPEPKRGRVSGTGVALGSLSTVDRIFLLRLIPEELRGEDFSLYALVGKLSSGFGPLVLWGGTILVMTEGIGLSLFDASRVAVGVLAAAALVGLMILRPLSDEAGTSTAAG